MRYLTKNPQQPIRVERGEAAGLVVLSVGERDWGVSIELTPRQAALLVDMLTVKIAQIAEETAIELRKWVTA